MNNMKLLSELCRWPLSIKVEKQMFKYLQSFPFVNKDRFFVKFVILWQILQKLCKAFEEDILEPNGWVKNLKNIVDLHEQSDLIKYIFKVIDREILKKDYKTKNQFLQKTTTDCYTVRHFYNYNRSKKIKAFSLN